MVLFTLLAFAISSLVLVKSSTMLVNSAVKIASYLKITEFAVGFMVVALGTSLPELFVVVLAGVAQEGGMGVGNVIGSNLVDLCIIAGVITFIRGKIKINRKSILNDIKVMVGIQLLIPVLLIDGTLDLLDGIILFFVFFLYARGLLREESLFKSVYVSKGKSSKQDYYRQVLYLDISLLLLLLSAQVMVSAGLEIANLFNIPPFLLGLTVMALGTSLPELFIESRAVADRHETVAIGDLLGSTIVNSTLVLGLISVFGSITINFASLMTATAFMLFSAFLFAIFMESESKLTWAEGLALILLYVIFLITQLDIQSFLGA